MKTYRHSRSPTKRFFRRALAYVGLYVEILSASCRWVASAQSTPYKTFVTRALKASGYIPPTQEEINAANAQQDINAKYALLTFHAKQPETIQTCLKSYNPELEKNFYKRPPMWAKSEFYPEGLDTVVQPPAVPKFVKLPEDWAAPSAGLDEDGYLK